MSRNTSQYYTAAPGAFQWSDDPANDEDFFVAPQDIGWVAEALENHTHVGTRGLPIGGGTRAGTTAFGQNSIPTAAFQAGSVTEPKMADNSVSARTVLDGAVAAGSKVANGILDYNHFVSGMNGDIAFTTTNGIIFGHGGWLYDFDTGGLTFSDRTVLQTAGGVLDVLNEIGNAYGDVRSNRSFAASGYFFSKTGGLSSSNLFTNGPGQVVLILDSANTLLIRNSGDTATLIAMDGSGISIGANTVWHTGNDGATSGLSAQYLGNRDAGNATQQIPISNGTRNVDLNADTVDGLHASAFAPAGSYLLLSGGTMTGTLHGPAGSSSSSPSFSVGGGNTGLYYVGTSQLGFTTGGTKAGDIDESQKWTMGPSPPAGTERLRVDGAVRGTSAYVTSVEKDKENITPYNPDLALSHLRSLTPSTYKRTRATDKSTREMGVTVEQLPSPLVPLLTNETHDAIDLYGLITLCMGAIKALDAKVNPA